jgi:hypothetical protein
MWRRIGVFSVRYEHYLDMKIKSIPVTGRGVQLEFEVLMIPYLIDIDIDIETFPFLSLVLISVRS